MDLEFYKHYHTLEDKYGNPDKILKLFKKFLDIKDFSEDGIRQYIITNEFDFNDYPPPNNRKLIEGYVDFSGEKRIFVDFITFNFDERGEIVNEKFTDKIEWKIMADYILIKYKLSMLDYLVKETYNKIATDINKTINILSKYVKCLENPTISDNWIQRNLDELRDLTPEDIQNDINKLDRWTDRIIKLNQDLRKL